MANVTAARVTNLHERIKLILGIGTGQFGYGQPIQSLPVSNQDNQDNFILAEDINSIYRDMINARVHQVGITNATIAQLLKDSNVIAEDASFFVDSVLGEDGVLRGVESADPDGSLKGIVDYENLMSTIEAERALIHIPSQAVLEAGISSRRESSWNGTLTHTVQVAFANADERRYFFNAGGEIRISANLTSSLGDKGADWVNLLSEIGTVKFKSSDTITTGVGSTSAIGNYQLTQEYQLIYSKTGSGIYSANIYTIQATESPLDSNTILFKIQFNDAAMVGNIDNNVDGRLESTISQLRADTVNVRVDGPSFSNISTLA